MSSLEKEAAACIALLNNGSRGADALVRAPALYQLLRNKPAAKLADIKVINALHRAEGDGVLETACLGAAVSGLTEVVDKLLKEYSCDSQCRGEYGDTPLHLAAESGHLAVVDLLITNHNCDPQCRDKDGDTPLHLASEKGHLETVEFLVSKHNEGPQCRNKEGKNPLHLAAEKGHLKIVEILTAAKFKSDLIHSKDRYGNTPLYFAVKRGHLEIVKFFAMKFKCDLKCSSKYRKDVPLEIATRHGRLELVKYLIEEHDIDLQAIGIDVARDAAKWGHLNIVRYLVKDRLVDVQSIATDSALEAARGGDLDILKYFLEEQNSQIDCSLLYHACLDGRDEIVEYLLSTGKMEPHTKSGGLGTFFDMLFGDSRALKMCREFINVKRSFPVDQFVKAFLLGHQAAGKSTLAMSIHERSSSLLPPILGQFRNVSGVQGHTAGIIPFELQSKELGHMVLYDFAGQPEYYVSHTAVMHNLLQEAPAVFICVVDVSKSEDVMLREVHYWLSFIQNESSLVLQRSSVILVASHADVALEEKQNLTRKCREISQIGSERLGEDVFGGVMPLDCRKLGGDGLVHMLSVLSQVCKSVRDNQKSDISWYCHMLHSFLETTTTTVACTINELSSQISSSETYLPQDPSDLCTLLSALNDHGLVLLLKNEEDLPSSWVIVKKQSLLAEVNGTLFAPKEFKEHQAGLASNTGIIPLSVLKKTFPHHNPFMLTDFLKRLEFCHDIDPATLEIVSSNFVSDSSSYFSTYDRANEVLLFFPALVMVARPEECSRRPSSYSFGWCLSCVREHQFLSARFTNILFLRLAYTFALAPLPDDGRILSKKYNRRCQIWKNGIHWLNEYGLESIVEVLEEGRCVIVLVSLGSSQPSAYAELCSSLVATVLSIQEEVCQGVQLHESLISQTQLQHYPWDDEMSSLALFDIKNIAQSILEKKPCVVDRSGREMLYLEKSLPFEPYCALKQSSIQLIFDDSRQDQLTSSSLIHEVRTGCRQILPTNSLAKGITLGSLRVMLNRFSLFVNRNPLVSYHIHTDPLMISIYPSTGSCRQY